MIAGLLTPRVWRLGARGEGLRGPPRIGGCASGSTCPTTGPTSRAGRPSRRCGRCRARSRTRWPRRCGSRPCGSSAPGAPTPASTRAGRSCTSTSSPRTWPGRPGRSEEPPLEALVRRLNGILPADVRVRRAAEAPEGFDARFSATWRRYAYRVADDPALVDPLRALARAGLAAAAGPRRDERGRRRRWWGCGTSRRSASGARVPPRSARCRSCRGARDETGRRRRPGGRRRVLPQHGALARRLPARRRGRAQAAGVGGRDDGGASPRPRT